MAGTAAAPPPPPDEDTWPAKRASIRAMTALGQHVEAMKAIMHAMRSFAERLDLYTLSIDTSSYYKNPAEVGVALKALAHAEGLAASERRVQPEQVLQFSQILAERGRVFLALSQPARALPDLSGAVDIHAEQDEETLGALALAREQVAAAAEEEQRAAEARKVPVTVLTGFLGSGKTTLLNHILRESHGRKIAVIENEVGSIGIDNKLIGDPAGIAARTEETVTLLDNGCLCCTVRSDLIAAVSQILDRAEAIAANGLAAGAGAAGTGPPLDAIVIETTGLADPGPVCKTFYAEESLRERTRIDGVLTVVDAAHFLEQLRRRRSDGAVNESAQQVGFADKLLLNKVDAVDAAAVEAVEAEVRSINAACPIIRCSLAQRPNEVPLGELLGVGSFCLDRILQDLLGPLPL